MSEDVQNTDAVPAKSRLSGIVPQGLKSVFSMKNFNAFTSGLPDRVSGLVSHFATVSDGLHQRDLSRHEHLQELIPQLVQEKEGLEEKLRNKLVQAEVSRESDPAVLQQIFDNERVHIQDSIEDMMNLRLGSEGVFNNKRVFKRSSVIGKQEWVSAAVFVAFQRIVSRGEVLDYSDIPGDVEAIKNMPVDVFELPASGSQEVVFANPYTVSSDRNNPYKWESGGRMLITHAVDQLHEEAEKGGYPLYVATTSPIRKFYQYYAEFFEYDEKSKTVLSPEKIRPEEEQSLKEHVLYYLLSEKNDVMNFHLGNGAYIGDIKFNPGNKTDPIIINYVYPEKAQRLENVALYNQHKLRHMAPHLYDIVKQTHPELLGNAVCVTAPNGEGALQPVYKPAPEQAPDMMLEAEQPAPLSQP